MFSYFLPFSMEKNSLNGEKEKKSTNIKMDGKYLLIKNKEHLITLFNLFSNFHINQLFFVP